MLLLMDKALGLLSPHICKGCGKVGSTYCTRCIFNTIKRNDPICLYCHQPTEQNNLCDSCCKKHRLYDELIAVGPRRDVLMHLVGDYKYNSELESCRAIARLLAVRIDGLHLDGDIIPIPTIPSHVRQRGFDHILMVAKQLAKYTNLKVNNKMLIRTDNTSQHTLSGSERKIKIKQSLALNWRYDNAADTDKNKLYIPNTAIVLDDIWTTGATMEQAARLLRSIGAQKIIGLVVLYQPK